MSVDPEQVSAGTVAEVLAWAETAEQADVRAVLDYERANKNRSTLVSALESKSETSAPVQADERAEEADPPQSSSAALPTSTRIVTPTTFTVTKDVKIMGVQYTRGQVVPNATVKTWKRLSMLLSSRIILPNPDPYHRKTDLYGFGDAPRRHPTPTGMGPAERRKL